MGQVDADRFAGTRIEAWLHRQQPHTATLNIPELGAAVGTTIGQVRKENQDRTIITRLSNISGLAPTTLFAVCDGMGGMVDGGKCAEKTLAVMLDFLIQSPLSNIKDRLRASILAANQEVFREYRQRGGTTLALVCHSIDGWFAATVGDTRIYSLSPESPIRQVSVDDTIAGELNRQKGFNTENPQVEPFANQLAQFVGIGPELEPRFYDLPWRSNMSYFIASDGAYNIGTAFERILVNASDPFLVAKRILSVSLWMGGKDNATIISIGLNPPEAQPASREKMLELWNATGKLEIIFEQFPLTPNRQSRISLYPKAPVTNDKYRSPKARAKAKQDRIEPGNPTQARPILEIDFGKPTGRDSKEPSVKDVSSQQIQGDSKLTSEESRVDVVDTNDKKEKTDGPRRGNI